MKLLNVLRESIDKIDQARTKDRDQEKYNKKQLKMKIRTRKIETKRHTIKAHKR